MQILNDFLAIFKNLPPTTIFLLLSLIILRIFVGIFGPKIKGYIGEARVRKELSKLPSDNYFVLNDILIKKNNDSTTQIDHIVISEYGIYVIETKHYKGWIHGKEYDKEWKQTIYKYKKKVPNPIRQNYGHIKSLEELLSSRFPNISFYSIIVFTGSATLKNIYTETPVIYSRDIINQIEIIESSFPSKILSIDSMTDIRDTIINGNIKDKNARKKHVRDIKNNTNKPKPKDNSEQKCPYCNGILIKKSGKYGDFLGCSNFPKCKFTKNIN